MNQVSEKRRKGIGWGVFASVVLHVAAVAFFLVKLPDLQSPPEEETVNVDLVPPEDKPEEKAAEEKPKEEAQKPPPAPPPQDTSAPSEGEKPQPGDPAAPKPALSTARPVYEFGPKDTGLQQPEARTPPVAITKPEDRKPAEQPLTEAEQPKSAENQPSARPVPQDVRLPEVEVAEVHAEKNGPDAEGTDEAKTQLEPEKPMKEIKPEEKETLASPKSLDAKPVQDEKLTEAKTLFSPDAISDPRIRTAIGKLSPGKRIKLLCVTELRSQLQYAEYQPDIVPFPPAGADNVRRDAFRDRGRWYNLSFRCDVDADATKVVSFSYAVGNAVPKSEWKSRGFPLD
ncbi:MULTISPECIES: DUF930 domain-containing protein [unclassified Sinorhizobium]|uniref:DUF930 domain-containing protein n=1 Tax=unclassified Sinorhizobium TaxID=2613772 RepID=UPI003526104B